MSKGYGYRKREPMEGNFVPGSPIKTPRNQLPRGLRNLLTEDTDAFLDVPYLLPIGRYNGSIFGVAAAFSNETTLNGGSTSDTDNGWHPDVTGLHGRYREVTHNGTGTTRVTDDTYTINFSPTAWLSEDSVGPAFVWRWFDSIGHTFSGTTAGDKSKMMFGITRDDNANRESFTTEYFLGFTSTIEHPDTEGVWKCELYGTSLNGVTTTTGVSCSEAHSLMIEVNGFLRRIRWIIDGVVQYEYYPPDNGDTGLWSHNGDHELAWRVMVQATSSATAKVGYWTPGQSGILGRTLAEV